MKIQKDKKALDKLYRRRNRYDLQPDFQREKVWSEEKEQKLMDTILKCWDIPKVYLNVLDEEDFEVIDGQQRLTAIFKFYSNELPLPKYSNTYGGLFYRDLPDKIKDIFDDYEIDLVLISDATEEDLKELFARLQLGVPLVSAEKLNAMQGNLRDFVKKLSEHEFFKKKTPLSSKRYAFQAVCAQITLLEKEGIRNAKFPDLLNFYEKNKDFDENSTVGKKIIRLINYINDTFDAKTFVFRNRASIVSFYLLTSELSKNGISLNEETGKKLNDFYIKFHMGLQNEVEKGAAAQDAELVVYQSKINQAADSKDSISKRHQILKRKLIGLDETFKKFLDVADEDEDITNLKKKDSIKQLTDECIDLMTSINKINNSRKGEDLFRTTTEMLKGIKLIGTPVRSIDDFKSFIDSSYTIFYEGSGTLKRIPPSLISNDSIFIEIKHLRTDIRHDIEHGKPQDIKEKKEIISKIYKKYTNKATLEEVGETELVNFQKKLLERINQYLITIKNTFMSEIIPQSASGGSTR